MVNLNALRILILTYFYIIRLRGYEANETLERDTRKNNDVAQLKKILEQLQQEPDFFSRKVIIDDQGVSIGYYLNISDGLKDLSAITKDNVYKFSHLTNIVLSCEYSVNIYKYIVFIKTFFKQCITENEKSKFYDQENKSMEIINCFLTKYFQSLNALLKSIPSMIFLLARLVKLTKNVVFKYHEIAKLLLSWYIQNVLYLVIDDQNKDFEHLISVIITNFQIKSRLEQFLVQNCHLPEEFQGVNFKDELNNKVTQAHEPGYYDGILNVIVTKLQILVDPYFTKDMFVVDSSRSNFDQLIKLITNEVSGTIQVSFINNDEKLDEIFGDHIENSVDIELILQYEKLLLDIITEIIVGREIKILEDISNNDTNSDNSNKCNSLFDELNNFVNNLEKDNQPLCLIKDLMAIKNDLLFICFYMNSYPENKTVITNSIQTLKKITNIRIPNVTNQTEFGMFLKSLSKMKIYAKLHPEISNIYWEQMRTYNLDSVQSFVVNVQSFYLSENPKNNSVCNRMSSTLNLLKIIEQQIKTCNKYNEENELESTDTSCFTEFNKNYDKLIIEIAEISLKIPENDYLIDWHKMLLKLLYNKNNIALFNVDQQKSLDFTGMQHLITFMNTVQLLFSENQYVYCNHVWSVESGGTLVATSSNSTPEAVNSENEMVKIENITDLLTNESFEYISLFINSFQTINHYVEQLPLEYRVKFKLYWDGSKKTLNDVLVGYKMNTFDLQDAYDYTNFFIKWIITIVYSRLMGIFDKIRTTSDYVLPEDDIKTLKIKIESFIKTELIKTVPVASMFSFFIDALTLFSKNQTKMLDLIPKIQFGGFEYLGYVDGSLPDVDGDVSARIKAFSSDMDLILSAIKIQQD